MLRILALLLLVGNALLLAAHFGSFDGLAAAGGAQPPQREPERLQRQINPQGVQILAAPAASAALAEAAASAAQAADAASRARAAVCLEAGPFSGAEAEVAERTLRDAGLAPGSWQALSSHVNGAFVVYMGRYADRETMQRKLDEVHRLKIEAEELRGAAELQPGLNLGRYEQREAADAALARLVQRGVRTARVLTLRAPQQHTQLRLAAADPGTRARLAGLTMPSGPGFVACAAAPAAVAASAAASSVASAVMAAAAASAPASTAGTARFSGAASAARPTSATSAAKPASVRR